jgi:hypothetical protein
MCFLLYNLLLWAKKKHFSFQCKNNVDPTIASILKGGYFEYGLEQCNQYVAFMGSNEIFYFIDEKLETCSMASKVTKTTSYLVNYCLEHFCDNHYIGQFVKNPFTGKESTNILHEEDDEKYNPR